VLIETRHKAILDVLDHQGSATVRELYMRFNVSPETIRRDLNILADKSKLRKAHGGAYRYDIAKPDASERLHVQTEAKRAIGILAASLIPDGATVVMECGLTVNSVADALVERKNLTVITNDLAIVSKLAQRNGNRVHVLGGEVMDGEAGTEGPDATAMLSHYVADFAVVGAGGITDDPWLMAYSRTGAELRRLMLDTAKTTIVVADSSKFEKLPSVRVCDFEKINYLVTDAAFEQSQHDLFTDLVTEVLIAE